MFSLHSVRIVGGEELFLVSIDINKEPLNKMVVVFNSITRSYDNYFVDSTSELINVSNTDNLLYSVDLKNKRTIISSDLTSARGALSHSIGEKTDEFTDDFVGAVAYNTNPQIAVLIAAFCQGCVKKWWSQSCP